MASATTASILIPPWRYCMQLSHFGRAGMLGGALLGGALLLAACGSSSSTPPPTTAGGGGATTTTAGGGATTTTAGGGATTTTAAGGGGGLNALATALQNGENQSFDAMYKATETNGQTETVEFASSPPSDYAIIVTNSSGTGEYIGTATHTYVCQPKSSGPASCFDLGTAGLGSYGALVQFYEGKFWYQDIETIKAYAGLAGFSVSNSTMSVAGQSLNCVTWSGGPAGQA